MLSTFCHSLLMLEPAPVGSPPASDTWSKIKISAAPFSLLKLRARTVRTPVPRGLGPPETCYAVAPPLLRIWERSMGSLGLNHATGVSLRNGVDQSVLDEKIRNGRFGNLYGSRRCVAPARRSAKWNGKKRGAVAAVKTWHACFWELQ